MVNNRVVLVTGGASGIGWGISRRFAMLGHPVAILDLHQQTLYPVVDDLVRQGGQVIGLAADVADREQVEAAYKKVRENLGEVDIVIPNAGYSEARDFSSMTQETWQRMIDVNLTGVFNTVQPALAHMIEQKWGRIVTISSHAAQGGAPDRAHYAAAKGGVISLTKALGWELAKHGITVNTIPPSLVATPAMYHATEIGEFPGVDVVAPMIPISRAGTPDDIADACEFLCSDKASYITGQQINVNGGMYM